VAIGGIGSFEGPIIGTLVFFLLREYLSSFGVWFILLGALSIGVILVEPRGLWGLLRRFLPQDLIPVSYTPAALKREAPRSPPSSAGGACHHAFALLAVRKI
jgi:branched-chain amino acid transport system permease protein